MKQPKIHCKPCIAGVGFWFSFFDFSQFDVDVVEPSCLLGSWGFVEKFAIQWSLLAAMVAFYFASYHLRARSMGVARPARRSPSARGRGSLTAEDAARALARRGDSAPHQSITS